jgi:hypothetical protein
MIGISHTKDLDIQLDPELKHIIQRLCRTKIEGRARYSCTHCGSTDHLDNACPTSHATVLMMLAKFEDKLSTVQENVSKYSQIILITIAPETE